MAYPPITGEIIDSNTWGRLKYTINNARKRWKSGNWGWIAGRQNETNNKEVCASIPQGRTCKDQGTGSRKIA
jgi:hypothetical protein